jgi:hypothetical protein
MKSCTCTHAPRLSSNTCGAEPSSEPQPLRRLRLRRPKSDPLPVPSAPRFAVKRVAVLLSRKLFAGCANSLTQQRFGVAQVGSLLCRRLAVGERSSVSGACGLPIRDQPRKLSGYTDFQSALLRLRLCRARDFPVDGAAAAAGIACRVGTGPVAGRPWLCPCFAFARVPLNF